jgi:hypothetical protein
MRSASAPRVPDDLARILALPQDATMGIWPIEELVRTGRILVEGRRLFPGPVANGGPEIGAVPPPLYVSAKRWLHPLLDLVTSPPPPQPELLLRDRVIGRAAALLALHLRIRYIWADVMSEGAIELLDRDLCSIGWGERVAAIGCRTEAMLANVDEPEAALELIARLRSEG